MSEEKAIQAPKGVTRFKEPILVRHQDAATFLWGDEDSHQVYDWIYGRGERISALIFSLRPGEYFKSSKTWKTLYNQHRFYYVLQGQLAIHDPSSGEVAVAHQGEAIYWSGIRWHFGYNFGKDETLVLDWYAPPERAAEIPEIVASVKKEDLAQEINGRYELLGKWPAERPSVQAAAWREGGVITIRREDCLHMILGSEAPALVSLFVSSEVITTGIMDLLPGRMTEPETHRGDEVVYCTGGRLNIYLPDTYDWFELHPKDCVFLPEGVRHQYCNYSDTMAQLVFAIAPYYR